MHLRVLEAVVLLQPEVDERLVEPVRNGRALGHLGRVRVRAGARVRARVMARARVRVRVRVTVRVRVWVRVRDRIRVRYRVRVGLLEGEQLRKVINSDLVAGHGC